MLQSQKKTFHFHTTCTLHIIHPITNSRVHHIKLLVSEVGLFRGIQLFFETRKMLDPSLVVILNPSDQGIDGNVIKDAVQIVSLSKDLHKQLLKLKGDFLQEGDGTVAYSAMRESSGFKEFRKNCSKLNNVDLSQLKEEMDKKAFFINVYNALTIHALAESVTNQKTVLQLAKFWQMYAYRIGSHDR